MKSPEELWFSDDFWGNRSSLIPLNSLNITIKDPYVIHSLSILSIFIIHYQYLHYQFYLAILQIAGLS